MTTITNAPRHAPNPYRHLRTDDLLREREVVAWDLAQLETDPEAWDFPDESVAFLGYVRDCLDREVARRRKSRSSAHAPAWRTPEPVDRSAEWAEIKRRTDLVEFIERYTPIRLRKAGRELVGCCPFPDHDDGTPSFRVNPEKQVFCCFGCGRAGDVFVFARQWLGLDSFVATADVLATWSGFPPNALYVQNASGDLVRVK